MYFIHFYYYSGTRTLDALTLENAGWRYFLVSILFIFTNHQITKSHPYFLFSLALSLSLQKLPTSPIIISGISPALSSSPSSEEFSLS